MAGKKSGYAVSHLVERFNQKGLSAIQPRHGGSPAIKTSASEPERVLDEVTNSQAWTAWQVGLSRRNPPIRKDSTLTHVTDLGPSPGKLYPRIGFVVFFAQGVMPLYTPLGGSWLNMAESIQRILIRRGLAGQNPETPKQIVAWLEAVARGWNNDPTPFEWGGARAARRKRCRGHLYALGGSGACTHRSLRLKPNLIQKWHSSC